MRICPAKNENFFDFLTKKERAALVLSNAKRRPGAGVMLHIQFPDPAGGLLHVNKNGAAVFAPPVP
jgi:hypothetical protein